MSKYSVSIRWSDEDEGFIAFAPELPGLSAFGNSAQEAAAELEKAQEAYLETLRTTEQEVPAPNVFVPYSGQIRLRMPKTLHAKLAQDAAEDNVSLNTYIVSLLSERRSQSKLIELVKNLSMALCNNSLITYQAETTVKSMKSVISPELSYVPEYSDSINEQMRRVH